MAYCADCGDWFDRDPGAYWKKLCLDCWRAKKTRESNHAAALDERIADLLAENDWLRGRVSELSRLALERPATPAVDDQTWRFLVMVAHPDRHRNSPASNAATRWLLALRGARK